MSFQPQAVKAYQGLLNANGFPAGNPDGVIGPRTRAATLRFQRAFAGGKRGVPLLRRDGVVDAATLAAAAQLPHLSPNFRATEFLCKCTKRPPAEKCKRAWVQRELIIALEAYRRATKKPLTIVSGYRCERHNKDVGGAKASQHCFAGTDGGCAAADVPGHLTVEQAKALRVFGGIGFKGSTGKVTHVDVRQVSKSKPTVWRYSS